jgi:hypothetical protein
VDGGQGFPASAGETISWPDHAGLDLRRVPGPETGWAVKLFAQELQEGRAAVVDPQDGARLEFSFDPNLVTHLGLWLNYGGWAGAPGAPPYYNIGFEPCIGAADRLDLAVKAGEYGLIPGKSEINWWLDLALI